MTAPVNDRFYRRRVLSSALLLIAALHAMRTSAGRRYAEVYHDLRVHLGGSPAPPQELMIRRVAALTGEVCPAVEDCNTATTPTGRAKKPVPVTAYAPKEGPSPSEGQAASCVGALPNSSILRLAVLLAVVFPTFVGNFSKTMV